MSNNEQEIQPNRDRVGYAGNEQWIDGFERKTSKASEKYKEVDKSILRKKDKSNRFFVDNEYIEKGFMSTLPLTTSAVFFTILKHSNTKTQCAFPSIKTICRLSGVKNRNYVITSIRILEEFNIMKVIRSKGGINDPNLYAFVDPRLWERINPYWKNKRIQIKQYQQDTGPVTPGDDD